MKKMDEAEDLHEYLDNLKLLVKEYVSLQKQHIKLSAIQHTAKFGAALLERLIAFILFALIVLFAALTLGFWLSRLTGSLVAGFGIVTILLIISVILLHAGRRTLLVNPLLGSLIRKLQEHSSGRNNSGSDEK